MKLWTSHFESEWKEWFFHSMFNKQMLKELHTIFCIIQHIILVWHSIYWPWKRDYLANKVPFLHIWCLVLQGFAFTCLKQITKVTKLYGVFETFCIVERGAECSTKLRCISKVPALYFTLHRTVKGNRLLFTHTINNKRFRIYLMVTCLKPTNLHINLIEPQRTNYQMRTQLKFISRQLSV